MGCYRFGEVELDLEAFVLRRQGVVVPLPARVLDVLAYLVEHRGRLVSKTELLDELWKDVHVTESVVAWNVSHARRALGQGRGDKQPIETVHRRGYRFVGEVTRVDSTAASTPAAEDRPRPTLVGREQVMADLGARVTAAARGRGGLCALVGEAGIGKTRCLAELTASAGAQGVLVVSGRCPEEPPAPPLWPLTAQLIALESSHPELTRRARELRAAMDEEPDEDESAEAARFARIEQGAELLREAAARQPMLLLLDDLHWADAATLGLLRFIAQELSELPLLVVVALREGEGRNPRALSSLARRAHRVPLDALDGEQIAELAQVLTSQRPGAELSAAIRRATGGVPLFVQEVVRTLALEHGGDALERLSPQAVEAPELARDLLRRRMESLPETLLELLCCAAAIGDDFDLSLLASVSELEPDAVLETLELALDGGQLESVSPHRYHFAHSLFRSAFYEGLSHAQRVDVHRRIARVMEGRPESPVAEVARHYYLSLPAGDPGEVMQHALAAAHAALRASAFEDAARCFGWALSAQRFGGARDARRHGELLLALASAQRSAGRFDDAMETSARLLELAQQHELADLVVRVTRLRRPTVAMATLPDATLRAALEGALAKAEEGANAVRISALSQLACLPPYAPDLARSKDLAARAVELAEQLGDRRPLFEAMRAQLFSLGGPDDIEQALSLADRMIALDDVAPLGWQSGDARAARVTAHLLAGHMAEVDAAIDAMAAAVPGRQRREALFYCERLRAQRLFHAGHFDRAEQRWQELVARATRSGLSYAHFFHSIQKLRLAVVREGPRAQVTAQLRASMGAFEEMTAPHRAGLARLAALAGDREAVRAQLLALGDPEKLPRDGTYLHTLACMATCAAALGDGALCEQLLELLSPYARFNTPDATGFYLGSVAHFLGVLAAALDRASLAEQHFELGLQRNREMGYRPGIALTLFAHGRMEHMGGTRGGGRERLAQARALAQEIGMHGLTAEVDALTGPAR
ncbi:MAG: AAA family ATPase [Myxococcales bacterium]|nr:AAA family ATPase [Myxococcales bacterium]